MSHKNSTYKPLLAYMCYEYLLYQLNKQLMVWCDGLHPLAAVVVFGPLAADVVRPVADAERLAVVVEPAVVGAGLPVVVAVDVVRPVAVVEPAAAGAGLPVA